MQHTPIQQNVCTIEKLQSLHSLKSNHPRLSSTFVIGTAAYHARFNSVHTIATSAICGCRMTKALFIVLTADFVVSVGLRIIGIATIAACALICDSSTLTIVRRESSSRIVPSVWSTCSLHVLPVTKCPVDMPFIGTVSVNWQSMTYAVLCAKRRPLTKSK